MVGLLEESFLSVFYSVSLFYTPLSGLTVLYSVCCTLYTVDISFFHLPSFYLETVLLSFNYVLAIFFPCICCRHAHFCPCCAV
jgi:hypothetical protein